MHLRIFILLLAMSVAHAVDLDGVFVRLSADDAKERVSAIESLAASGDPRLVRFFEDYRQGSAYLQDGRVVLVPETRQGQGVPLHPLSRETLGAALAVKSLGELPVSRRERMAAGDAITRLRLVDPDPEARLSAIIKAGDAGGAVNRDALTAAAKTESVPRLRRAIDEGLAIIALDLGDTAAKAAAARTLGELRSTRALGTLRTLAAANQDAALRSAVATAIEAITTYQGWIRSAQTLFSGLSAGSILIIMALGLSITFGLMGVINMAHGEMLMVGAYATLAVQWLFGHLPAACMPFYFPVGVVGGFCAAAVVGWLLELTVIRHLYGRPLETLLATWGVSYLLIQTARVTFGDNQAVTAPAWLVGGWEPVPDLVLPFNRLFIIALTGISLFAVAFLMNRTRLGLMLRATTQSRRTAASLGVNTRLIDGATFAFGSGLAGAAGCALTLISGLKPDMGQEYIIDSFLVVATGGVGSLAGVVWSGLGLGIASKLLEPFTQAVFAKVLVLIAVILFLQWRPQGLFAPRGRLADG